MRLAQWSPLLTLAFAACSTSSPHDPTTGGDDDPGTTDTDTSTTGNDGSGSDSPTASCAVSGAPGTFALRTDIDALAAVVAADHDGNVFYVGSSGVTKLDATLAPVFTYPHGEVVTVDAAGNAYVAGAFRESTDFGTGVIRPAGNVDVYLVKLSPSGDVLAVSTLGECGGDGMLSIALDASTGRIAISGTAMGTVVVDQNGALVFQLAAAGKLAFDASGNLVIGGAFAGGIDLGNGHRLSTTGSSDFDGFVARYDASGRYQLAVQFGDVPLPYTAPWGEPISTPQNQAIAGVATRPDGSIALVGTFYKEMSFLGRSLSALPSGPEGGTFSGPFAVELDAAGNLAFVQQLFLADSGEPIGGVNLDGFANGIHVVSQRPGTAIAVNSAGDIFVSTNIEGNVPPFSYPQLTKLDGATGAIDWGVYNGSEVPGVGLGVAIDGCGNVVWADTEFPLDGTFTEYFRLSKLAP